MNIFKTLFFLFLIIAWGYLWYYLSLGIARVFDKLIKFYKNRKSKHELHKPNDGIENLEDMHEIKKLLVSLQGMTVDYVDVDEEESYLSVLDEKVVNIALKPDLTKQSIKNDCFLVPAFKWKLVSAQNSTASERLICSNQDTLEIIEDAMQILNDKKLNVIEFLPNAIKCCFEDINLIMEYSHSDIPACYVEVFLSRNEIKTVAIKPKE